MVGLSWALSAVISVPPLFGAGDPKRDADTTGICAINHNRGYAVFSTVCAFYLPLLAMMIIYARVYRAARSRIRKQQFQRGQGYHGRRANAKHVSALNECTSTTIVDTPPTPHRRADAATIELVVRTTSSGDGPVEVHPVVEEPADTSTTQRAKIRHAVGKISIIKLFTSRAGVSLTASANCRSPAIDGLRSPFSGSESETPFSPASATPLPDETGNGSPGRHFKSLLRTPTSNNEQMSLLAASALGREKQKQKRERKAARTLAIVTGTFVVCWLPFFIVALVQPFCDAAMAGYPDILASVIVWLGYVNSLLNPVIYTIFNPDFRSAFRKILFGRCDRHRNQ